MSPSILVSDRNCGSVRTARRASLLIDAETYFSRLRQLLCAARRSITIVGWDFDARIRLRPESEETLGTLLRALVDDHPELQVRVLIWNLATIDAPGETTPLVFGAEWSDHPRIDVRLDHNHPLYGAQHQKIVCIDERMAFVGGIDLTVDRWDSSSHLPEDPRRTTPDGEPGRPVHDMQLIVDGGAARAVADVVRERWCAATGDWLPRLDDDGRDLWPADLAADFEDAAIGVSQTLPRWNGRPGRHEVWRLTQDALSSATRSIYIEAQYLADPRVGELLVRSLERPDGPEVVIVVAGTDKGFLEWWAMGGNRDRLIRRLERADRRDRFRAFYPTIAAGGEAAEIFVHSKLMIIDDRLLRVGSGNLNQRSTGLDSECDLSIEARDERDREVIARLRATLVAEHVGASVDAVLDGMRATGSLVATIDALNTGPRRLSTFDDRINPRGPVRPVLGTALLDPDRPFRLFAPFRRPRAASCGHGPGAANAAP